MNLDDLESIGALMVRFQLGEVTISPDGLITVKKSVHTVEQPQREPRERPPQRDPMDEDPLDDEVLFHSTQALHATVDDLIRRGEKDPDGSA